MKAKTLKHAVTSFFTAIKTKNIVPIEHIVDDAKVLDKKVALITGGSGGIGYAIAKSFIESGCHVIITGTNAEKLKSCVEKLGDSSKGIFVSQKIAKYFVENKIKGHILNISSSTGGSRGGRHIVYLNRQLKI